MCGAGPASQATIPNSPTSQPSPYSRQRAPGESLSLRQRAPALLLKKLDEFEEKAHKIWAKAELEEENRKITKKKNMKQKEHKKQKKNRRNLLN